MSSNDTGGSARHIPHLSRWAFAATLIALGLLGLVKGGFAAIWVPVPQGVPARAVLAYLCALVLLASGVGLLWRRVAAVASGVLLVFLLAWLVLLRLPHILVSPSIGIAWAACKTAVMTAGAWVLFVGFAGERDRGRLVFAAGDRGLRIARALYGLALIPFGIAHFTYLDRTVSMVPGWLPAHLAWAIFTGCAFIAAGVAVIVGLWARLAAVLSVVQVAGFTLLVWLPVVVAGASAPQWREIVVSVAMTTAGWVVADSYRGMPWLAVGKR